MPKLFPIAILLSFACNLEATSFEEQMKQLDTTFFERSFNACDISYLDKHVSPKLVFYHDQSGVQDFALFKSNIKKYICGGKGPKPIRHLFPGSLTSNPLYKDGELYGVIQQGSHAFYLQDDKGVEIMTSTADFIHTWLIQDARWVLSNVLSYNHQSPDDKTKKVLEILSSKNVPALAIGVINNGEIVRTQVYGKLDKISPAPQNALFKVASLTKPIVSMITLKLIQAGQLSLDEPLAQYYVDPDLDNSELLSLLTVKHAITHQTGFMNWRWMSEDNQLKFQFPPGQGFGYSGEGFEYLRKVLEAKFNKPMEALAEELVFRPAGMSDTHFWWDESVDVERYARNYNEQGDAYLVEKYYEANAAANVITTISDYTKFLAYVLNQKNEMPKLYYDMISKQVDIEENHYFGLGWEVFSNFLNGDKAVMHTGKDPGVNTLAVFFPKSENGYVIFMNGDNALPVLENVIPDMYLGNELWNRR